MNHLLRARQESDILQEIINHPIKISFESSFYILTDAQGKTIAQNIQILKDHFDRYPPLPSQGEAPASLVYHAVAQPRKIEMGTLPIVNYALQQGNFLSGLELLNVDIHSGIDSTLLILQHRLKANGEDAEIQVIKQYVKQLTVDS